MIVKELDTAHNDKAEDLKAVIGKGEAEAIALCEQERHKMLLTDDLESIRIAEARGIACRTTLGLLYEALNWQSGRICRNFRMALHRPAEREENTSAIRRGDVKGRN